MIRSFIDFMPDPRFDSISWNRVKIEEGPAQAGPWTEIEAAINVGIDVDPANPSARSFTTTNATIEDGGWYRITWIDTANNFAVTEPIQQFAVVAWRPSLSDVGKIDMARTRNNLGVNIGTFNLTTQPTADQVQELIEKACNDLRPKIGTEIPENLIQDAQDLAALRTAMYIELSFFGTEIAQNRSPYPYYKDLWAENLPGLVSAIAAVEAGEDMTNALEKGTSPAYGFPTPSTWLSREI